MSCSRLSLNAIKKINGASFKNVCSFTMPLSGFYSSQIAAGGKLSFHEHMKSFGMPFSAFSRTVPSMETMTIKVPTMGDSITEGTIVEWTVGVGEAVREGDVIALVETDKVTVDIKAEVDGVIVSQNGSVDDTIEVGADLYQLDTEGAATVVADLNTSSEPTNITSESNENDSSPPVLTLESETSSRIPSIHFLGKVGWKKKRENIPVVENFDQPQTIQVLNLDPMYGRPAFTEEEMEALLSGGANLAPKLESFSR